MYWKASIISLGSILKILQIRYKHDDDASRHQQSFYILLAFIAIAFR
jgi:hypothetical protein